MFIAPNLSPPYFAVIFTSLRDSPIHEYDEMAEQMNTLVRQQPGFLAMESSRDSEGRGITVCYWDSIESIKNWKEIEMHKLAQELGRSNWYLEYAVRIAEVTESYEHLMEKQ